MAVTLQFGCKPKFCSNFMVPAINPLPTEHEYSPIVVFNPFKPEFTIVIFIRYKPRIAVAILDL